MGKTNQNHIVRQWHIIQYLIACENYVSCHDVVNHLQLQDIQTTERTVQRDLNTLATIMPIECRKDDKPYSWRWQRLKNTKQSLMSHEQALVLKLVDTQLREILPIHLLNELSPLFLKAHLLLAGQEYETPKSTRPKMPIPIISPKSPSGVVPNMNTYNVGRLIRQLAELNPFKSTPEPWQNVKAGCIYELQDALRQAGFEQMADSLDNLADHVNKTG